MKKTKKNVEIEDAEDKAMIAAYRRGAYRPVRSQKMALAAVQQSAIDFRKKKEARINIRLNGLDLDSLKMKAEEEGIPYQTLISSILHKYISGRLVPTNNRA